MEPMEVDVDIDTGAMELKNPEKYILAEIENKKFKRKNIAKTYALILRDNFNKVDWKKINTAIIDRWSTAGLIYIKNLAWSPEKLFS